MLTKIVEQEKTFTFTEENIFLKSNYNFCGAATLPHFALIQCKEYGMATAIKIDLYHEKVTATIEREPYHSYNSVIKFIKDQKGDVEVITREEFFDYYNKHTDCSFFEKYALLLREQDRRLLKKMEMEDKK